ncbi:MAG TPA: rubredoxin [Candidatus Lokiarchaeia archaeon]|nr:rubredoxin [Candidatus Lokiarchaeia archaeon]
MSIKTRYEVWNCDNCDFEYHEKDGLPEEGIEPGTTLDSLPDDWVCPKCGGPKDEFASWAEHEETM